MTRPTCSTTKSSIMSQFLSSFSRSLQMQCQQCGRRSTSFAFLFNMLVPLLLTIESVASASRGGSDHALLGASTSASSRPGRGVRVALPPQSQQLESDLRNVADEKQEQKREQETPPPPLDWMQQISSGSLAFQDEKVPFLQRARGPQIDFRVLGRHGCGAVYCTGEPSRHLVPFPGVLREEEQGAREVPGGSSRSSSLHYNGGGPLGDPDAMIDVDVDEQFPCVLHCHAEDPPPRRGDGERGEPNLFTFTPAANKNDAPMSVPMSSLKADYSSLFHRFAPPRTPALTRRPAGSSGSAEGDSEVHLDALAQEVCAIIFADANDDARIQAAEEYRTYGEQYLKNGIKPQNKKEQASACTSATKTRFQKPKQAKKRPSRLAVDSRRAGGRREDEQDGNPERSEIPGAGPSSSTDRLNAGEDADAAAGDGPTAAPASSSRSSTSQTTAHQNQNQYQENRPRPRQVAPHAIGRVLRPPPLPGYAPYLPGVMASPRPAEGWQEGATAHPFPPPHRVAARHVQVPPGPPPRMPAEQELQPAATDEFLVPSASASAASRRAAEEKSVRTGTNASRSGRGQPAGDTRLCRPCGPVDEEVTGEGLVSVGTIGHPKACRGPPCKYVRRKNGCRNAASCPMCHLCFWKKA